MILSRPSESFLFIQHHKLFARPIFLEKQPEQRQNIFFLRLEKKTLHFQ